MKTRELPVEEWNKLEDRGEVLPDPNHATAIVVEDDDGNVIGHAFVIDAAHVEHFNIDEQHRKSSAPLRLWGELVDTLDRYHVPAAFCLSDNDEIDTYLERLGCHPLPALRVFLYIRDH